MQLVESGFALGLVPSGQVDKQRTGIERRLGVLQNKLPDQGLLGAHFDAYLGCSVPVASPTPSKMSVIALRLSGSRLLCQRLSQCQLDMPWRDRSVWLDKFVRVVFMTLLWFAAIQHQAEFINHHSPELRLRKHVSPTQALDQPVDREPATMVLRFTLNYPQIAILSKRISTHVPL